MTNAEKYFKKRKIMNIVNTVQKTVPNKCPMYIITGEGFDGKCCMSKCKTCISEWLKKEVV